MDVLGCDHLRCLSKGPSSTTFSIAKDSSFLPQVPACVSSLTSNLVAVFQSVLKIWSPEFNIYYDKDKSFI